MLRTPILEDVSRIIARATGNPFLKGAQRLQSVLSSGTWVRGISLENHRLVALGATLHQHVNLLETSLML